MATPSLIVRVAANIAAFKAAMRDVADDIKPIAKETANATTGANALTGSFGRLASAFAIGSLIDRAVSGLFNLGKEALESASRLIDLSGKTGLSTETLQRMQHVADQTGATLDAFTDSSFKLGVNIEIGTTKVRDAVGKLGLSYTELAGLKPEDQFHRVVEALGKQESSTARNALGFAVFGKGFSQIAASIADDYDRIAQGASVATDRQLQSLDKAGDAWAKFTRDVQTEVTGLLGTLVLLATHQETGKVFRLTAEQQNLLQWYKDTGKETKTLMAEFVRLHNAQKDIRLSTEGVTAATVDHVKQLKETQAALRALTPEQRAQIDAAIRLTGVTDELGDQFNLSKEALKLYEANARTSAQAIKEHETKTEAAKKEQEKFLASVHATTIGFPAYVLGLQDVGEELQNIAAGLEGNGTLITGSIQDMGAAQKAAEDWAYANGAMLMPSLQDTGVEVDEVAEKTRDLVVDIVRFTDGLAELFGMTGHPGIAALARGFGDIATALRDYSKAAQAAAAAGTELSAAQSVGSFIPIIGAIFQIGKAWDAADEKKRAALKIQSETSAHIAEIQKMRAAYIALGLDFDELTEKQRALFRGLFGSSTTNPDFLFGGPQGREALKAFMAEFEKRLAKVNDEFGDLLGQSADLGQRLPDAILASLEKLREMGLLTEENVASLAALTNAPQVDWERQAELAKKYGIDLAALGPAFQSSRLHATAQELWNDFMELKASGTDAGTILLAMSGRISQLVTDSLQFGTSIPENFRPLITNLLESGKLVDENGVKLTSLAGLQFGDPIVAKFDQIVAKLQELIDKITGPLVSGLTEKIPAGAGTAEGALRDLADRGVGHMSRLGAAIRDEVIRQQSPTGLEGIASYAGYAADALKQLSTRGIFEMTKLGDVIDLVVWDFEEKWLIGLVTWVDGFEDAAKKVIRTLEEVRNAIPNEEDMAGIMRGSGDPLQGGIGRGGSGDVGMGFNASSGAAGFTSWYGNFGTPSAPAAAAASSSASSLSTAALEREMQGLRRELPRAIAVAVDDAMQTRGRRR